jgi:hypothetical protein
MTTAPTTQTGTSATAPTTADTPTAGAATTTENETKPAAASANSDTSEEGLPPEIKSILKKERDARKAAEKLANEQSAKVRTFEDANKTAEEKLVGERDALKSENEKLRLETLRRDVAAEKGIDPKAMNRLQGTTREELEADADSLLQILKPGKAPFGDVGQGSRNAGGSRIYTRAELNDHTFFTANKQDILLAQQEGRITD